MEEEKKIILYTIHCSRCNILEKKLNMQGIKYEICEDVETMYNLNIKSAPMLQVGDELLEFGQAINWLKAINTEA